MATINSLNDAFIAKLQALYDVEKELERALPDMEKAASDPELKNGFRTHLEETMEHSKRLEEAFGTLDMKPKKLKVEAIRGIISDGEWVSDAEAPAIVKDIMLASAARHAEHYEISGYTGAIEEANALGFDDISSLLSDTLEEENSADDKLASFIGDNLEIATEVNEMDAEMEKEEVMK